MSYQIITLSSPMPLHPAVTPARTPTAPTTLIPRTPETTERKDSTKGNRTQSDGHFRRLLQQTATDPESPCCTHLCPPIRTVASPGVVEAHHETFNSLFREVKNSGTLRAPTNDGPRSACGNCAVNRGRVRVLFFFFPLKSSIPGRQLFFG